jgi:hypothetical protein
MALAAEINVKPQAIAFSLIQWTDWSQMEEHRPLLQQLERHRPQDQHRPGFFLWVSDRGTRQHREWLRWGRGRRHARNRDSSMPFVTWTMQAGHFIKQGAHS